MLRLSMVSRAGRLPPQLSRIDKLGGISTWGPTLSQIRSAIHGPGTINGTPRENIMVRSLEGRRASQVGSPVGLHYSDYLVRGSHPRRGAECRGSSIRASHCARDIRSIRRA